MNHRWWKSRSSFRSFVSDGCRHGIWHAFQGATQNGRGPFSKNASLGLKFAAALDTSHSYFDTMEEFHRVTQLVQRNVYHSEGEFKMNFRSSRWIFCNEASLRLSDGATWLSGSPLIAPRFVPLLHTFA